MDCPVVCSIRSIYAALPFPISAMDPSPTYDEKEDIDILPGMCPDCPPFLHFLMVLQSLVCFGVYAAASTHHNSRLRATLALEL